MLELKGLMIAAVPFLMFFVILFIGNGLINNNWSLNNIFDAPKIFEQQNPLDDSDFLYGFCFIDTLKEN